MGKDYYKLLGVDKGAGEAELKKGKLSGMSSVMLKPLQLISCCKSAEMGQPRSGYILPYGTDMCTWLTRTSCTLPALLPCCHSVQEAGNAMASGRFWEHAGPLAACTASLSPPMLARPVDS